MGCTRNSPEEAELAALTDVTEAYERRNERWVVLLAANQHNEGAQLYTALVST